MKPLLTKPARVVVIDTKHPAYGEQGHVLRIEGDAFTADLDGHDYTFNREQLQVLDKLP